MELLEGLRPVLWSTFARHRPVERLVSPFVDPNFVVKIKLLFASTNEIQEMDLEISSDPDARVVNRQGCWLGAARHYGKERLQPWGPVAHRYASEKGYAIASDYGFSLSCPHYPGRRFTDFLFALFFFVLKMHSAYFHIPDAVITDSDQAMIGRQFIKYLKLDPSKAFHELMNSPILYYERFGFIYPEKEEWVRNYVTLGRAFVTHRGEEEEILEFYLDLGHLSMRFIYSLAENVQ